MTLEECTCKPKIPGSHYVNCPMFVRTEYKWVCPRCGCRSFAQLENCPNGCAQELVDNQVKD